jgi:hypothetical protein
MHRRGCRALVDLNGGAEHGHLLGQYRPSLALSVLINHLKDV